MGMVFPGKAVSPIPSLIQLLTVLCEEVRSSRLFFFIQFSTSIGVNLVQFSVEQSFW